MDHEQRYADYLLFLYEIAGRHYADCPEIEALIQDCLVALIVREQRGDNVQNPQGFLSTVLRNKHNDWLRQKYKSAVVSYELPDIPTRDTYAVEEDDHAAVRREIGRLIKIYREVTVRYYLRGRSVEQIAEELGIPKGTVLSRLSASRRQLKGRLQTMESYSKVSYDPKHVTIGIWGWGGLSGEPFALLHSKIEENILYLAYEQPISVQALADAMGMPCPYIEPAVDRLVAGELLGRTSGGLVYTRCFMQRYKDSFGDIPLQEALAAEKARAVWAVVDKHTAPLMTRPEVAAMTDKQKATLLLLTMVQTLWTTVRQSKPATEEEPSSPPERPNGGRWLAIGTVFDSHERRNSIYDASGPCEVTSQLSTASPIDCKLLDYQSVFGDAHWAYKRLPYAFPYQTILRFYASLVTPHIQPDNPHILECIPLFEELHILRRDADGNAVLDIPALTMSEEAEQWAPARERIVEELHRLLDDDLLRIWNHFSRRVPKTVDEAAYYKREGALNAYATAQILAVLEQHVFPYPVVVGETPLILVLYRDTDAL